jgi:glutaredoxin
MAPLTPLHQFDLPGTVTVFSKTTCSHCKKAKELLTSKNQARLVVIQLDEAPSSTREFMLARTDNAKTVPQIFFNDVWIPGGAANLANLDAEGQLDALMLQHLSAPAHPDSPVVAAAFNPLAELQSALMEEMAF